jgi:hypothetical protein
MSRKIPTFEPVEALLLVPPARLAVLFDLLVFFESAFSPLDGDRVRLEAERVTTSRSEPLLAIMGRN